MLAIGCDHGGLILKAHVLNYLSENAVTFKDFGTYDENSVDYPDIAAKVCAAITSGECEAGILICGTGVGMSIAANKVAGIRAAVVSDTFSAKMAREHNNAQILCLGERTVGASLAVELVKAWIGARFQEGRHTARVDKIAQMEKGFSSEL